MWKDRSIPPLVEDWRSLNSAGKEIPRESFGEHLKIRVKETMLQPYKPENFLRLIQYDMQVFQRFITRRIPENSVIVIVGDHQPPLVTRRQHGTETIVHVISRDTTFLQQFSSDGFSTGFRKDVDAPGVITHADIFPILMRNLHATNQRDSLNSPLSRN
ncbi:MAG: hypothetical protein MAGBODY4_00443 [Candidatus Marinimicrobia bacterium]|nr:hypothetical protein [Candidatus Neomarinimicrobiota bacterium]